MPTESSTSTSRLPSGSSVQPVGQLHPLKASYCAPEVQVRDDVTTHGVGVSAYQVMVPRTASVSQE